MKLTRPAMRPPVPCVNASSPQIYITLAMNKEIQSITRTLRNVLSGQPWYGKSVYAILEQAGTGDVYHQPGKKCHSNIELLYHMITWVQYVLCIIKNEGPEKAKAIETLNWQTINPTEHDWEKGVLQFKSLHNEIIELLDAQDDSFLGQNLEDKKYNFRFLLNGLIQHHIYHAGQIAYISNLAK